MNANVVLVLIWSFPVGLKGWGSELKDRDKQSEV